MPWSGPQESQGHKPTPVFAIRNVCLIRQYSSFSGNLPFGEVVSGLTDSLACLNGLPLSLVCRMDLEMKSSLCFHWTTPWADLVATPPARWPCPSTLMSACCPEKQPMSVARSSVGAGPSSKRQGDHLTEQHPTCGGKEEARMSSGSWQWLLSMCRSTPENLSPWPLSGSGNKV